MSHFIPANSFCSAIHWKSNSSHRAVLPITFTTAKRQLLSVRSSSFASLAQGHPIGLFLCVGPFILAHFIFAKTMTHWVQRG